ncbi:Animal haem peroxidase [Geodermatophilus obscurus]|uniref:Animal haem peroxidase n=1 Tax=Geodermatophilus obscurus TaxID=1861 RepID=A0A1I5C707_9ACTN|nr:Animal haem peroxidase [Geodermatophilus obscurus]
MLSPVTPVQDVRMFLDPPFRAPTAVAPNGQAAPDDFNKLFPHLPPFAACEPTVIARIRELGKRTGLMDALDPRVTVTNPLAANDTETPHPTHPNRNPDNPNPDMTVGFTFLGQFIDHDLTFDPMPIRCGRTASPNLRSRFFDLDSVYGRGPDLDRLLYDRASELDRQAPVKFFVDFDAPRDLPRTSQLRAVIADPRNDENVITSQLHLAFLRFHNEVTDHLAAQRAGELAALAPAERPRRLFELTRESVRRHYQWVVVEQFLAATLDPAVLATVAAAGPTVYTGAGTQKIPREFQVAAYRFGHSQIRPGYKLNVGFGAPIFDARVDPREEDPNDLRGGRRAPRRFVEWDTFFDFGTKEVDPDTGAVRAKVKRNKRIDPYISSPMFDLPVGPGLVEPDDALKSLAGRNLERHLQHGLASGQDIATALGYTPLAAADLSELQPLGFESATPLWYYVLKEALVQQQGTRLGEVGSRIIAEVFYGLLLADSRSYLNCPGWTPDLPRRDGSTGGGFTMTDLLTFAGVA